MSKATLMITRLHWTHATSLATVAIHIGFLWQVVRLQSIAALVFGLIVVIPPFIISAVAIVLNRAGAPSIYSQSLSTLYLILGAWAYYDAIYIQPDPQNGLVFINIPILGVIVTAIVTAVVLLVFQRDRALRTEKHDN